MPITADTKNWTWVLDEVCPECGYDAAAVDLTELTRGRHGEAAQRRR